MLQIYLNILILFFIFIVELTRKKLRLIDGLTLCFIWYSLYYIITPSFFTLINDEKITVPFSVTLLCYSCLFCLSLGFFVGNKQKSICVLKTKRYINYHRLMPWVTLVGCIFFYLYVSSFGGLASAIATVALNRYSGVESISSTNSIFFLYGVRILEFSFTWYLFLFLSNKLAFKSKRINLCLFLISASVILCFALVNASRGSIFSLFIIALLLTINSRELKTLKVKPQNLLKFGSFLSFFLISGVTLTIFGKVFIGDISRYFRGSESYSHQSYIDVFNPEYLLNRLVLEFSHPIRSLSEVYFQQIEPNLFYHFVTAPLDLVPTKLLGIEKHVNRITEINTLLLTGSDTGGIPPGLLASFWYGGGIFGCLLGTFLFGFLVGILQKNFTSITQINKSFYFVELLLLLTLSYFISSGDLSVWMKHSFPVFVFIFISFISYFFIQMFCSRRPVRVY